ncbi:MAG TPA: hypothetical protein VLE44_00620 [Candidatus Saccharimonadales bacterium]|nr:hypothetical protein [Candidatus Saccharimonadales bacterium]
MITPHRLKRVDMFYRRFFEEAILHDLEIMSNTEGGLNFVIASSILGATNLLGNLCQGSWSNKSIEAFIKEFFPEEYKEHASILGNFFRNSLVHTAYTPRGSGVSRGRSDIHLRVKLTPDGYSYIIDSDQLHKDFKHAMQNYFKKVKSDEKILENFESFLDKIERQFPEEIKPRLIEIAVPSQSISNATYYPYPQYFDVGGEKESNV